MLGNYLKFNNKAFPNPLPSSIHKAPPVENVSESEAGTDLVVVVRAAKNNWSFVWNLSYQTKETLKGLCLEEKVTMVYMGTSYTVRLRDYTEKLVEGSEWLSSTDGLYEVSVTVLEY